MRTDKIAIDGETITSLIKSIADGDIRIPRFQRHFLWEKSRILKLLDSICQEFPIGTIILWKASAEYNYLWREIPDLDQPPLDLDKEYNYVLDGQQRLTSLYVAMRGLKMQGIDGRNIVVDLKTPLTDYPFLYRIPDDKRYISVADLLDEDGFSTFDIPEYRREFEQYRNLLTRYPVPVTRIDNMILPTAIEAFERLNRQGLKLSRYDFVAGVVFSRKFDLRERVKEDLTSKLGNFGMLSDINIVQALALNVKKSAKTEVQMKLSAKEIENAWTRTAESLKLAIEFVQANLGVVRADFLPYEALIPVIAHYFFENRQRKIQSHEHVRQIQRWFWCTIFSEKFYTQPQMTIDAVAFGNLLTKNTPVECHAAIDEKQLIENQMTYARSPIRNGVLCLLSRRKPKHFENGTAVEIDNSVHFTRFTSTQKHHIFPVSYLRSVGYETNAVHSLANFCFIPAELNVRLGSFPPSYYMRQIADTYSDNDEFAEIMDSHFIPIGKESGIWEDNYELFRQQRAEAIVGEIRQLCSPK